MKLVSSFFENPNAVQTWVDSRRVLSDDEHKAFSDMINFLHFCEYVSVIAKATGVPFESTVRVLSSDYVKAVTGFDHQYEHLKKLRAMLDI